MKSPIISIIIPVYNVELYLRKCLDSVLVQTFLDWECILVDDGSPDDSGELCDEYVAKDSRFKVIHKQNGGVSSARNVGLENVKGAWITFVDADDWLTNDALETLFTATTKYSKDLIMCKHVTTTDISEPQHAPLSLSYTQYIHEDAFSRMIDYRLFTGPVAKLFKKEMIGDIRFKEGVKIGEDQLFCLEYLLKNKIGVAVCDTTIYYYYQNEHSALHSQKSFRKLYSELLDLIRKLLKDYNLFGRYKDEYFSLRFKLIRQAALDEEKGYTNEEIDDLGKCYKYSKHLLRPYLRHYFIALRFGQPFCNLYCSYYELKKTAKVRISKFLKQTKSFLRL